MSSMIHLNTASTATSVTLIFIAMKNLHPYIPNDSERRQTAEIENYKLYPKSSHDICLT